MSITHTTNNGETVTEYEGVTLQGGFYGRTFNDGYDQTYEALVYDTATGHAKRVYAGSTMGDRYVVIPDASDDIYVALMRRQFGLNYANLVGIEERHRKERAEYIDKGDDVEVYKGRKVAKGTIGRVTAFYQGDWGMRVKIQEANGTEHWLALDNVRSLAVPEPLTTEERIELSRRALSEAVAHVTTQMRYNARLREPGKAFTELGWTAEGEALVARLAVEAEAVELEHAATAMAA